MSERVLIWDWKNHQLPVGELAKVLLELSDGKIHLAEPDTGGDFYALVVSDHELSDEQAEQALADELST